MARKYKLSLGLAAALPLAAGATQAGIAGVSNAVPLAAGQAVRAAVDAGAVSVTAGSGKELRYEVRFQRDRGLLGRFSPKKDGAEGCAGCSADYTGDKGLVVKTAPGVTASVTLAVPAEAPVTVDLTVGTLSLSGLGGKVAASVETGSMDFDASGLPEGACVDAGVKVGAVTNRRDTGCKTTAATLRVKTGTISVR